MKVTIENNDKKIVFEGEIVIVDVGTKDDNGFINGSIYTKGCYCDLCRCYLGISRSIHEQFLTNNELKEEPKGKER